MLPTDKCFGKLEMVEVHEYYDRPVLFACINENNLYFLAVLEDEDNESETYLYSPLYPHEYAQVRNGEIDLYNAFKHNESGYVYEVRFFRNGQPDQIRSFTWSLISDERLPERGERLSCVNPD